MKNFLITTKPFPGAVFIEQLSETKYCYTSDIKEAHRLTKQEAEALILLMHNSNNSYFQNLVIYEMPI